MCLSSGVKYRCPEDAEVIHLHFRTLIVCFVALVVLLAVLAVMA